MKVFECCDSFCSSLEHLCLRLSNMNNTCLTCPVLVQGISVHDLRDHVRQSMSNILLYVDATDHTKERLVMLIGSLQEPQMLLDAETRDILWDRRRNAVKEVWPWLNSSG